jgi:hypothetical protein
MDTLENYSCLFNNSLTDRTRAELGSYAAQALVKVATGDADWCVNQISKLANEIEDPDVLCDLLNALEHAGTRESTHMMSKIAKKHKGLSLGQKINLGVGIAGIGLATAPMIEAMVNKRRASREADQNFHMIMSTNSHLRSDPLMPRYHETIKRFSPRVASDPILLSNALTNLQSMGPAGLTVGAVREMAELSHNRNLSPSGGVSWVKTIGDVASRTDSTLKTTFADRLDHAEDPRQVGAAAFHRAYEESLGRALAHGEIIKRDGIDNVTQVMEYNKNRSK